jgi:hypothetical protein
VPDPNKSNPLVALSHINLVMDLVGINHSSVVEDPKNHRSRNKKDLSRDKEQTYLKKTMLGHFVENRAEQFVKSNLDSKEIAEGEPKRTSHQRK